MSIIDDLIRKDRESKKRIAVIGDDMTDAYVIGHMEDCQDGLQKFVQHGDRILVAGGAGNAARQLDNWNADANLLSYDNGIGPIKTRYMVEGKIVFRCDDERPVEYTEIDMQGYRKIAFDNLSRGEYSAILLSDYDKGLLTPAFIRQIIDFANERRIPVVADAKRKPELYRGAIIKCNDEYAKKYITTNGDDQIYAPMVVTRGDSGYLVYDKIPGKSIIVCSPIWFLKTSVQCTAVECRFFPPSKPIECVNHVGAGDCFAAHLVLALAHGFTLADAAAIAHSAGRVYVQHPFNRPPTPAEIKADMESA